MNSMTGFGKSTQTSEKVQLEIELKSVNHRFLDIQCRMPRECNAFEMEIRSQLKHHFTRGRIECFIHVQKDSDQDKEVVVHWNLLDQSMKQIITGAKRDGYEISEDRILASLLHQKTFVDISEGKGDVSTLQSLVLNGIKEAILQLEKNRSREGRDIQQLLLDYTRILEEQVKLLQKNAVGNQKEYQERLTKKIKELTNGIYDEARILTEVAILLDKGDINEELDRLLIHLSKMNSTIVKEKETVGRELDFLVQEMNREINTVGSKSSAIFVKDQIVKMKTILEKVREQIQNIE